MKGLKIVLLTFAIWIGMISFQSQLYVPGLELSWKSGQWRDALRVPNDSKTSAVPSGTELEVDEKPFYLSRTVKLYERGKMANNRTIAVFIGSGFFVKGGYVVTTHHVVADRTGSLYAVDGESSDHRYDAELVASDPDKDLALLRTDVVDHAYFELADKVGYEEVSLVGTSYEAGERSGEFRKVDGEVKTLSKYATIGRPDRILSQEYRMFVTALAFPGYSGGPAFNKEGKLVGVAAGAFAKTHEAVLVKLDHLREFLEQHKPSESSDAAEDES